MIQHITYLADWPWADETKRPASDPLTIAIIVGTSLILGSYIRDHEIGWFQSSTRFRRDIKSFCPHHPRPSKQFDSRRLYEKSTRGYRGFGWGRASAKRHQHLRYNPRLMRKARASRNQMCISYGHLEAPFVFLCSHERYYCTYCAM